MVARMLLRWVLVIVALPLVAALIRRLSQALEERGGRPTRTSVLLRRSAEALERERVGASRRRR
jgi:hypothetical protein